MLTLLSGYIERKSWNFRNSMAHFKPNPLWQERNFCCISLSLCCQNFAFPSNNATSCNKKRRKKGHSQVKSQLFSFSAIYEGKVSHLLKHDQVSAIVACVCFIIATLTCTCVMLWECVYFICLFKRAPVKLTLMFKLM